VDTHDVIVAITAEDGRFSAVQDAAEDLALRSNADLILYDWDSAMLLGDPLPSVWSAEGTDAAVPDRLDAEALDAAGRSSIADQVRRAEGRGIVASAWLPSTHDVDALAAYATDQGAGAVLIPSELQELRELESAFSSRDVRVQVVERP
jgi:hypothetical protein